MIVRNWLRRFTLRKEEGEDSSTGGGAIGTGNDDRVAKLNAIGDNLDDNRSDELANVNDDDTTEPFTFERSSAKEAVEDEEDPPVVEEKPPEDVPQTPAKIKIKVNGQDLELTQEELIERAQKVESADRYLAEAARAKRESTAPAPAPATQPTAEELQRAQDEEDKALVRAIQMGTEEEATAALRKLRTQSSARPSITEDDVSRTIDQRLAFTKAVEKFNEDYSDIVSDPILYKLVLSRDTELLEQGDNRPYQERYSAIGDEVRAWKKSLAPAVSDAPPAAPAPNKQERKAAAPQPPRPASAKTTPPKEDDDVEESPAEVIANMRKHRGGPQWMRG